MARLNRLTHRLHDWLLERRIQRAHRSGAYLEAVRLVKQRSPKQVRRMEIAKGLL